MTSLHKHNKLTLADYIKMEKIQYPQGYCNNEAIVDALHKTKEQFDIVKKIVQNGGSPSQEYIEVFYIDTQRAIQWWITYTYVGKEKPDQIKIAFQDFYQSLYQLLLAFKKSEVCVLRQFADEALYQGVIYRWLGYGESCASMETARNIIYDNIYVSWSKKPNIPKSIKDKLYGTITKITCEISGKYFAIDLMAFFNKPINDEDEIVFPTVKKLVTKTEVISRPSSTTFDKT